MNNIDPDIQVHILTAIYGSKISYNPLCRMLSTLNIAYEEEDSLRQLRRKLKSYILRLRSGKDNERAEQQNHDEAALHEELLDFLRQSWPRLVPQTLKNKILRLFRDQTGSEALATFTCASCSESTHLRAHCSITTGDPHVDLSVHKRPDLKS